MGQLGSRNARDLQLGLGVENSWRCLTCTREGAVVHDYVDNDALDNDACGNDLFVCRECHSAATS